MLEKLGGRDLSFEDFCFILVNRLEALRRI